MLKVCICSECKDSRKHKEHEVFLASEVLEEEKELVDADIKKGLDASRNLKDFLEVAEQVHTRFLLALKLFRK